MDQNNLVVGRVETIRETLKDFPSNYLISNSSFLSWLNDYKKAIQKKLDKATVDKNDREIVILTSQLLTCSHIEIAYIKFN